MKTTFYITNKLIGIMNTSKIVGLVVISIVILCSCTHIKPPVPTEPQEPEVPVDTVEVVPQGEYPKGMKVEELSYTHSDGKTTRYFLATIDFSKNPKLKFNVIATTPKRPPTYIFSHFNTNKGEPYLISNGGYFSGSISVSLVISNGFCETIAPLTFNWPNDENPEAEIHPVRGAFGQMEDGSFDIAWVYCCEPSSRLHYSFPSPLDNNEKSKTFMTESPKKDYPGAKAWKAKEAIGGGPILVMNKKDVSTDSYWRECLDAGGTSGFSRVPRTAVGIKGESTVFLIVCDGRGMKGSPGLTLAELAGIFIKLGADKALNLDGGGSSAIVGTGGELLNWPSDSGTSTTAKERAVPSLISFGIKQ